MSPTSTEPGGITFDLDREFDQAFEKLLASQAKPSRLPDPPKVDASYDIFDQLEALKPSKRNEASPPAVPPKQRSSNEIAQPVARPTPPPPKELTPPPAPIAQPPKPAARPTPPPPPSTYSFVAPQADNYSDEDEESLLDDAPPPPGIDFTSWLSPQGVRRPPLKEEQALRRENLQSPAPRWLPQAHLVPEEAEDSSATESSHPMQPLKRPRKRKVVLLKATPSEEEQQDDSFAAQSEEISPRAAGKRKAAETTSAQQDRAAPDVPLLPPRKSIRKRFKPRRSGPVELLELPKRIYLKMKRICTDMEGPHDLPDFDPGSSKADAVLPDWLNPRYPATYTMYVHQDRKYAWMRGALIPPPIPNSTARLRDRAFHAASVWSQWTYTFGTAIPSSQPPPSSYEDLLAAQHDSRHSNTWVFTPSASTLYKRARKPQLNVKMLWKFRVDGVRHKCKREPLPVRRGRRPKILPFLRRNMRMYGYFLPEGTG